MGAVHTIDWRDAAASTLDWWHDAGVDTLVEDELRDWFMPPTTARAPLSVASTRATQFVAEPDRLPDTLDAFVAWRLSDAAPEASWNAARILPAQKKNSALMIVADMPEADDSIESGLMTGTIGTLLDRMLAAVGLVRDAVLLSTVAVARPVTGRIAPDAEADLFRLIRHHVRLAQPRRLLLFGPIPCRAILGPDGNRGSLQQLNHDDIECRTVASFHPRFLLERPRAKAEAWRDLQLLFRETDA